MKNKYGEEMVRISGLIPAIYNEQLKEIEKERNVSKSLLLREAIKIFLSLQKGKI